jgi:predicted nucleic acid-binding protein
MAVLTDINIFLRILQPHHPHCRIAERALDFLRAREEILNVTSQNLMEVWAAATRPFEENGLGLTVEQAGRKLEEIKRFWVLVPDTPLFEEWERLVRLHRVSGKNTHDARLVAAMRIHGIKNILTFNAKDFVRYADITVLDPAKVE